MVTKPILCLRSPLFLIFFVTNWAQRICFKRACSLYLAMLQIKVYITQSFHLLVLGTFHLEQTETKTCPSRISNKTYFVQTVALFYSKTSIRESSNP